MCHEKHSVISVTKRLKRKNCDVCITPAQQKRAAAPLFRRLEHTAGRRNLFPESTRRRRFSPALTISPHQLSQSLSLSTTFLVKDSWTLVLVFNMSRLLSLSLSLAHKYRSIFYTPPARLTHPLNSMYMGGAFCVRQTSVCDSRVLYE